MGEDATADAVRRARELPALRVGLHVVVADGRPVLSADQIPGLVDGRGRLDSRLVRAGFRFFFSRSIARQLEAEIHAQFTAFAKTGLALDHVNAHKHMHLHPTVLSMILKIGSEYGMRAVRLPYELPVGRSRVGLPTRLSGVAVTGPWAALMRRRLRRAHICYNDSVLGLGSSGAMDEDRVLGLLRSLPEGTTEMYFHPATEDDAEARGRGYRQEAEFMALMSPRVRQALQALGVPCLGFCDLVSDANDG